FFQAEDGIRGRNVTGVQTCALPIWFRPWPWPSNSPNSSRPVSAASTSTEVLGPEPLRDLENAVEGLGLPDADAHALAEVAHGHGAFDTGVFERRRQTAQRQPHEVRLRFGHLPSLLAQILGEVVAGRRDLPCPVEDLVPA